MQARFDHLVRDRWPVSDWIAGGLHFARLWRSTAARGEIPRGGSSKKGSYFGNTLDQFRHIGDKLHNSVPKGGEDRFVPFTQRLFYETLPGLTGVFVS
jgi:hypothetical protein